MSTLRQRLITKPFRGILLWLLPSGVLIAVLASPLSAFANTSSVDCLIFKLESHFVYRFIDSKDEKWLRTIRDKACKLVEDHKVTLEKMSVATYVIVSRYGYCRGTDPNPSFTQFLEEKKMPEPVIKVLQKYCSDTFNPDFPEKWRASYLNRLRKRHNWLGVELFCQYTRHIADPGGWAGAIKPDLPSFEKLKEQAYSICADLRDGKITLDEAEYRWEQELLWLKRHLTSDVAKDIANDLRSTGKFVLDVLKFIKSKP